MKALRNCSGTGAAAKNVLNGRHYPQCPKMIYLENISAKEIVKIYFDCREGKYWPYAGSALQQTAYCVSAFELLDELVYDFNEKHYKKQQKEQERKQKELESKMRSSKRGR